MRGSTRGRGPTPNEGPLCRRRREMHGTVRAAQGRVRAISVFHRKSFLYDGFVWVHRALNSQKRWFPARAVAVWLIPAGKVCVGGLCVGDSFYLVLPACSISAFMGGWSVLG